jgi:hypothetical protein
MVSDDNFRRLLTARCWGTNVSIWTRLGANSWGRSCGYAGYHTAHSLIVSTSPGQPSPGGARDGDGHRQRRVPESPPSSTCRSRTSSTPTCGGRRDGGRGKGAHGRARPQRARTSGGSIDAAANRPPGRTTPAHLLRTTSRWRRGRGVGIWLQSKRGSVISAVAIPEPARGNPQQLRELRLHRRTEELGTRSRRACLLWPASRSALRGRVRPAGG